MDHKINCESIAGHVEVNCILSEHVPVSNFRFSDALDQFIKSQTMVNHKIVPGVLTWPTTSQVIEETRTENLQVCLKKKKKRHKNLFCQMAFPKNKNIVILLPACPLSRPKRDGGAKQRFQPGAASASAAAYCQECCQPQELFL